MPGVRLHFGLLPSVKMCDEGWWSINQLACSFQSPFCSLSHMQSMISKSLCLYCFHSLLFCRSRDGNAERDAGRSAPDNPVVCKAEDSFMCTVALDNPTSFVTVVTVSVSDSVAPPVLLRIPARPGEHLVFFDSFFKFTFLIRNKVDYKWQIRHFRLTNESGS